MTRSAERRTWQATTGGTLATLGALVAASLVCAGTLSPAVAGPEFDGIKSQVFGDRPIHDGRAILTLDAPYRPDDVRAVPMTVEARLADGRAIRSVTFIVDNNPMPVVAAFQFGEARDRVSLGIKFRLNQQSDVRAILEASDGRLYMASRLVKFAGGQAACSAPPSAPPEVIAANLGKMTLTEAPSGPVSTSSLRLKLSLSHPNHTGMVLDQQTLLYTPLRMVEQIIVRRGEETMVKIAGSIGLKEDPEVIFESSRNAQSLTVDVLDTDGAVFTRTFPLEPQG